MFVRYANQPEEIEILTGAEGFLELSKKLLEDGAVIPCQESGMDVAPYSKFLRSIVVQFSAGRPAEIQVVSGETLSITGDQAALRILSSTLANFARDWTKGEHVHIEYYDGHPSLSPESVPVVLTHL